MYKQNIPVWILDPKQYIAASRQYCQDTNITRIIILSILQLIMLCISYKTNINLEDSSPLYYVSNSVPCCDFYTIQLKIEQHKKIKYNNAILHIVSSLYTSNENNNPLPDQRVTQSTATITSLYKKVDNRGILNASVYCYLKHITFDLYLMLLTKLNHSNMTQEEKERATKNYMNNQTRQDLDHGALYFYLRTCKGPEYSIPFDWLTLAKFLVAFSVKMCFAFSILAKQLKNNKKTVMVYKYPITFW